MRLGGSATSLLRTVGKARRVAGFGDYGVTGVRFGCGELIAKSLAGLVLSGGVSVVLQFRRVRYQCGFANLRRRGG